MESAGEEYKQVTYKRETFIGWGDGSAGVDNLNVGKDWKVSVGEEQQGTTVITTKGTTDILSTGNILVKSDEHIEARAPRIDLN